ncbi:hypothetical protein RSOLAG1IB_06840 [Rhizoctonia solani AG-1 IB]|uniref:Zn(2)-C6 fungal-type domain-containing protein n=1 Tax=Thanatephorus cucumeris (strain AG1-IB / isolate 7/3/14) TaxID=1108050 RepID=A0A0B7FB51_THACB|nr:hypothetical protein RSOLAG1IB_06840 [Rhizoctonia solani AG-1 IB]
MSLGGSYSQRSRSGCLTCRRKRKKCDEQQPFCSRCTRTNSRCIWPGQSESDASPPSNDPLSYNVNAGDVPLSFLYPSEPTGTTFYASENTANQHSVQKSVSLTSGVLDPGCSHSNLLQLKAGSSLGLPSDIGVDMNLAKPIRPSWIIEPQSIPARSSDANGGDMILPDLTHNKAMGTRIWEYAQDFGPRIIWPNRSTDDNDDFDPEGVMPLIRRSVATLRISEEPNFQQMLDFYSIYLSRYISDYAAVCDILFSRTSKIRRIRLAEARDDGHGVTISSKL